MDQSDDDSYDQMEFEDAASEADSLEEPPEIETAQHMDHNQLRLLLKARGIHNSFKGATTSMLQKLLHHHSKGTLPIKFYTKSAAQTQLSEKYKRQWHGITLQHLAAVIEEDRWLLYQKSGWIQFHLHLDKTEQRMMIEAYTSHSGRVGSHSWPTRNVLERFRQSRVRLHLWMAAHARLLILPELLGNPSTHVCNNGGSLCTLTSRQGLRRRRG